jgi:hypothetical protein
LGIDDGTEDERSITVANTVTPVVAYGMFRKAQAAGPMSTESD